MSSDTPRLEKREIPTTSESNDIRRGSEISRDDFNGEVRFVIRDLKTFRFFSQNYYFTLYPKSWIFWGFTIQIVFFFILRHKIGSEVQEVGFSNFRERVCVFSLDFPSFHFRPRSKAVLSGKGYAWASILWSFDNFKW